MSQMPPDCPVLDDPLLDPDLLQLLAPLPGPDPCGISVRTESLFTDIRLAREEDDPALPMRQWERPLKKADWQFIESSCRQALSARSKDLQLAAWLTEAWTRQGRGFAGLARGLLLLRELVARFWEGLYPRIDPSQEESGCEARIAPLDWLDESMAHTLRVHIGLLPLADHKLASVSLADWERLIHRELAATSGNARPGDQAQGGVLSRDVVIANVAHHQPEVVAVRLEQVRESRTHLAGLSDLLRGHLGSEAPTLRKLDAVLQSLERVLSQVQLSLPVPTGAAQEVNLSSLEEDTMPGSDQVPALASDDPQKPDAPDTPQPPAVVSAGGWTNRDDAYRTLEALAIYLSNIEPHSPTPYLIRRAVNWGRLPLPELMTEIMQEEGDLNRLVQLLGLRRS